MTNLELSKANSKIYKLYGRCAAFLEIWDYLDKKTYLHHQEVTAKFSPQTTEMLKAVETEKTVMLWRPIAAELKHSDKDDPLSKKIYAAIRNCKDKDLINVPLSVDELEIILEL
jgi:hypothetical protein